MTHPHSISSLMGASVRPSFYTIKPLIENIVFRHLYLSKNPTFIISHSPFDSYNLDLRRPAPLILFCKGNAVSSNVKYLLQKIFL